MLLASAIFSLAGPWNKAAAKKDRQLHRRSCHQPGLRRVRAGRHRLLPWVAPAPAAGLGFPVLLVLAFISGAGYGAVGFADEEQPISRIAIFGLIIPIMNVLLSALLNGEPLFEWQYIAALALVCGHLPGQPRPHSQRKAEP